MKKICILLVFLLFLSTTGCRPGEELEGGGSADSGVSLPATDSSHPKPSVPPEKEDPSDGNAVKEPEAGADPEQPLVLRDADPVYYGPRFDATALRKIFSYGIRDGITDEEKKQILSLLVQRKPSLQNRIDEVAIDCLGVFGSGAVFFVEDGPHLDVVCSVSVGEVTFVYPNSNALQFCNGEKLCSLTEAYEEKLLSDDDLRAIQKSWSQYDGYRISVSSSPLPVIPAGMQEAWSLFRGGIPLAESENYRYINYGGDLPVFLFYSEKGAVETEAAGTVFRDHRPFEIFAYSSGRFLSLADAHAAGLLSGAEISEISRLHQRWVEADRLFYGTLFPPEDGVVLAAEQAFLTQYRQKAEITVQDYYGVYSGLPVLLQVTDPGVREELTVGSVRIPAVNDLWVLFQNEVIPLRSAWEQKLLCESDLAVIAGLHRERFPGYYQFSGSLPQDVPAQALAELESFFYSMTGTRLLLSGERTFGYGEECLIYRDDAGDLWGFCKGKTAKLYTLSAKKAISQDLYLSAVHWKTTGEKPVS